MIHLRTLNRIIRSFATSPRLAAKATLAIPVTCDAETFAAGFTDAGEALAQPRPPSTPTNALWDYFQDHTEGRGIVKWTHYFDIYQRHFAKFVGQPVNVLEVGIYSGGSLGMWRSYFGEQSHVYGVDINPACRAYEGDGVSVFIGDQQDRSFWNDFRTKADGIDILIDDGGHTAAQQQVTLEEMLPHLRPGGVYLCEDVHGHFNRFAAFAATLVNGLNDIHAEEGPLLQTATTSFQASIYAIHFYPYVVVIEKQSVPVHSLSAPRQGTEWIPRPEPPT
ncbi:unannotated protein [freshwater metagenome]|uniref:Unannotated protein n=1 Tax=freshwater metagenome TaxID=449393 RepID=A0A6J7FBT6_9ZZZZ|nr:class I SAM-dependent methyltransferase [Actinomycetota bacterium]